MNLSTEKKETYGLGEQTCGFQEGGNGMYWEFVVSRCKLLHLEWISNEILPYAQGITSSQMWWNMMEDNEQRRLCVFMYIYDWILYYTAEIDRTL